MPITNWMITYKVNVPSFGEQVVSNQRAPANSIEEAIAFIRDQVIITIVAVASV